MFAFINYIFTFLNKKAMKLVKIKFNLTYLFEDNTKLDIKIADITKDLLAFKVYIAVFTRHKTSYIPMLLMLR